MEVLARPTFSPTVHDYDLHRHDLPTAVAEIMGVDDLRTLGAHSDYGRFRRETDQSTAYHKAFYDSFETLRGLYRNFLDEVVAPIIDEPFCFQRIPTFRVHLPANVAVGEFHRDADYSHPEGEVNFWVPFTNAWETNTVWIEDALGSGNHSPAPPLSPGRFLMFDAVRWSHGNVANETKSTRVSFDFRCIPLSQYRPIDARTINTNQRLAIGDYFEV